MKLTPELLCCLILEDETAEVTQDMLRNLENLLQGDFIPERTRYILIQRYYYGRSLTSIGNDLGLSQQRVSQLEYNFYRKCDSIGRGRLKYYIYTGSYDIPITIDTSIRDIGLRQSVCNQLSRQDINTVGELANMSYEELKSLRGIGDKAVAEIQMVLDNL